MLKGIKGALLGVAFGAAALTAAAPAQALPTADSGFSGPTFVTLTLGGQAFYGAVSMMQSVGVNPVSSGGSTGGSAGTYQVGDFGGNNYAGIATFYLAQPYGGSYNNATLSFYTNSVTGSPTITASLLPSMSVPATTYQQAVSGTAIGSTTLSPSSTFGSHSINLSSSFTSSLGSSYQMVQVAITSGAKAGAGVPGPIAGAGLPFLAIAGGVALYRRRRAAKTGSAPLAFA